MDIFDIVAKDNTQGLVVPQVANPKSEDSYTQTASGIYVSKPLYVADNKIISAPKVIPKLTLPEKFKLWRVRYEYFFEEVLQMELDEWQKEFMWSFLNNSRTVSIASKGVGKTKVLAGAALYMLVLYVQPKIAVMSVTKDHLRDNLWAEMLKFIEKSPFLKHHLQASATKIKVRGTESAFISARSIPKGANDEDMKSALAGLHENHVAFMVDEAGSLPDSLWDTADAVLSNVEVDSKIPKFAKVVAMANAEVPKGLFYRVYTSKRDGTNTAEAKQWHMINISSDPIDPKRSKRVDPKWAQEVIDKYGGRDHPVVKINILGIYPDVSQEVFLSEWEIDEAMKRTYEDHMVAHHEPSMGVDVSRGGDDTIIVTRKGLKVYPFVKVKPGADGPEIGRAVLRESAMRSVQRVKVDGTGGYGLTVVDYLKAEGSLDVVSIVYNKSATRPDSFNNIRTEMYCKLRDYIRAGGSIPNDPMLKEDLLAPKLEIRGSRFALEPKEDIRKRLGRSPDRADALAQTFAEENVLLDGAAKDPYSDKDLYDENGNMRDVNEVLLLKTLKMRAEQKHSSGINTKHKSGDTYAYDVVSYERYLDL